MPKPGLQLRLRARGSHVLWPAPVQGQVWAGPEPWADLGAVVLAHLFPRDRERLLALAKEAGESRIWAGIHYRFDIDAGETLGRQVGEKVLARAFIDPAH